MRTVAAGGRDGGAALGLGDDQRPGPEVGEVEVELLLPVGRVQGCGRGAAGDGEEGRRHLRPVGQHDRHPVAAADAELVQAAHGGSVPARAGPRR